MSLRGGAIISQRYETTLKVLQNYLVCPQLSKGKQRAWGHQSFCPAGSVHCTTGGDFDDASSIINNHGDESQKLSCNDHYLITNQRNHYLYICRKHMFYFSFNLMTMLSTLIQQRLFPISVEETIYKSDQNIS